MHPALRQVDALKFANGSSQACARVVPEETPIALVYDGTTHAVMMASLADLEDFAIGFSLTEGKVAAPGEIVDLEIVEHGNGIEARMWLHPEAGRGVASRRRAMLGPTGCGLCGIDSLASALPEVTRVTGGINVTPAEIASAVASVRPKQVLNAASHALHAAGFWTPTEGLVVIREDVGRHNALDKLVGAIARGEIDASKGVVVLTSRLSVDMVQKAAILGAPVIAAVSAPTALALRTAEGAGITVVAVARADSFEVFTCDYRVDTGEGAGARHAAG